MSNKQPPGLIHSPKQLIEFLNPDSDGQWVEINNGTHGAAAFVVWRMEDDETGPKQEAFALKVAAVNELFDALNACADQIRFGGASFEEKKAVLAAADAAIAKAKGANHA